MTDAPMSSKSQQFNRSKSARSTWILLAVLVALELVCISLLYNHNFEFVCRDAAPAALCGFLSLSVMRAISFLGAGLIFALARPQIFAFLTSPDRNRITSGDQVRHWLWLHFAGFAALLLPWTFAADGASGETLILAFSLWIFGGMMAGMGAAMFVASPTRWRKAAQQLGPIPLTVLTATIIAPEITDLARGIWWIEPLTRTTFEMVLSTLDLFGVSAIVRPEGYVIGTKTFAIAVGSQCSGVEGFALITLFLLCYFYAFADDLRFPQVWVLLPVGLVLSWLLNIVRISLLFTIGSRGSPELAVQGFHSHAGWLMFSVLALSVIAVSRTIPWFQRHREARPGLQPLRQDWVAACIVPFIAFMGASLLLSTFTQIPALWYGFKVLAMVGALVMFAPHYVRISWRLDPASLAAGLAIGILWIVTSSANSSGDSALDGALAALPAGFLVCWIVLRIIGTTLLVPMVEELFFRGYVLDRLDRLDYGGTAMRLVALAVSSGLFAVLHDRWILAAIAGVVFGLLYLRERRITDAVIAHGMSNVVIAAYALAISDWSVI